jgi:hypothetical protein
MGEVGVAVITKISRHVGLVVRMMVSTSESAVAVAAVGVCLTVDDEHNEGERRDSDNEGPTKGGRGGRIFTNSNRWAVLLHRVQCMRSVQYSWIQSSLTAWSLSLTLPPFPH